MTFAEYFRILQRRWRVWASMLLVGLMLAAAASLVASVRYTATAHSFVTVPPDSATTGQSDMFQGAQFAVQRVKSYSTLGASPKVLGPVKEQLDMPGSLQEIAKRIQITSQPDTVVLDVSASASTAGRAAEIANAVSRQLGTVIEELERPRGASQSTVKVTLTEPATVPQTPSSPRTLLNLVLGAVAGLALGFAAAVLRNHFDRRIKTVEDLRALAGVSLLGSTPYEPSSPRRPLVALDWRSESAEAYRTIRTALKFASIDHDLRHFVVSSSVAGDGKTAATCNLAISWAHSSASVCLVEADLRRPKVAEYLGVDGSIGVTDVLVGEARLEDVLVPWNHGMLTVLPAGSLPPDPSALLGSEAMHSLQARLAQMFDLVIYDSPPLLPVTDAIVLGAQLDGLVLVVRHGTTTRDQLSACVELVGDSRVTLLGSILTGVRGRSTRYQSYDSAYASDDRPELALTPGRRALPGEPNGSRPWSAGDLDQRSR